VKGVVAIDAFASSLERYRAGWTVVVVDVIRTTTTAATALAAGLRCFPVPSLEAAVPLAARLDNPLLVGELGGNMPYGFDLNNSPARLALRNDSGRPMILLSTSGTGVLCGAQGAEAVYAASVRNLTAQVERLAGRHERVAVIGAGTRGEFREEDQLCCAWLAERLLDVGYEPRDGRAQELVDHWKDAPIEAIMGSKSATYLRDTGQRDDLDFILAHVDDLDSAFELRDGELMTAPATP
jgi:2-phosphosulfolactate phosphatase